MIVFTRKFILSLSSLLLFSVVYAQSETMVPEDGIHNLFAVARERLEIDPIIQNGIYYENTYYNARGHQFLEETRFNAGTVVFRNKEYRGVSINYDIFNQQVILSKKSGDVLRMNILTEKFLSAFSINGRQFIRTAFEGNNTGFYQVLQETDNLSCYYYWYKDRRESLEGNFRIYSFSEPLRKSYVLFKNDLYRFKNNRSFLRIFPDDAKPEIRRFLKRNSLSVKKADNITMSRVIRFCDTLLNQSEN